MVDDLVVAPKDLNVTLKLVNASTAGRMSGRSKLTVSLDSFVYQGKRYMVSSSDVQAKGGSRGKRSAAVIGGGAALGAIIGGIVGGGKGPAIGAAAGGGGGVAVQALTKGEQVKIPAETRLDFTLHAPIDMTFLPGRKAPRPNSLKAYRRRDRLQLPRRRLPARRLRRAPINRRRRQISRQTVSRPPRSDNGF